MPSKKDDPKLPMHERAAYASAFLALEILMDFDPKAGEPAGVLLQGLAAAIEDYEQLRWPLGEPTPEEAAAFRAEQEKKEGI